MRMSIQFEIHFQIINVYFLYTNINVEIYRKNFKEICPKDWYFLQFYKEIIEAHKISYSTPSKIKRISEAKFSAMQ